MSEKILVIALPGIGDALLTTPMIELLRQARPNAEIHALVMFGATRAMFEEDPCIDRVHFHDFLHRSAVSALAFVYGLRRERFDISINTYPQNRREYNLIARLIGAKRRIGIRYRRANGKNLNWLNSHTLVEDDTLHCVQENVRILSLIGEQFDLTESALPRLRIGIPSQNEAAAADWFSAHDIDPALAPLIGFHAGTALFKNHIKRRWATENFAELAVKLHDELGMQVLLFGGPDDVEANAEIIQRAPQAVVQVQTTNILDSVAIMQKLSLFVSNDSALMHIAGALGLPTVAIFGPTNEAYVHPWKTRYEIVHTAIDCRPCFVYSPKPLTCYRENPDEHFQCIREISVQMVLDAVVRLLPHHITT